MKNRLERVGKVMELAIKGTDQSDVSGILQTTCDCGIQSIFY